MNEMADVQFDMNVENIAASLYRCVHQGPWRFASDQQRQGYMAIARQTVESVKLEQAQQQPEDGQKDVA